VGASLLEDVCICKIVSLKFPIQDPLQPAASSNTAMISDKLIFCAKMDLFIQHLLEIVPSECAMLGDQDGCKVSMTELTPR